MAFYLLENDGHNTPCFWKFKSQKAAEQYLIKTNKGNLGGLEDYNMELGYFDNELSWTDADGTLWEASSGKLYIHDMTKEK